MKDFVSGEEVKDDKCGTVQYQFRSPNFCYGKPQTFDCGPSGVKREPTIGFLRRQKN